MQKSHLARVEQIVNVLQEALVLDLRIGKQKHHWDVLAARLLDQCFEVLAPSDESRQEKSQTTHCATAHAAKAKRKKKK